jgi:hypothetical protein
MVHKKCSKCGLAKPVVEFYQRRKGLRSGEFYERCKNCFKERGRKYYHENHDRQLYLAKLRKQKYIEERKKWLEKLKNQPCSDCGKIFPPWVMDFDHGDGELKVASISWLAIHNTSNFETIQREIDKCDLVCANCHRQRTHERLVKRNLPR